MLTPLRRLADASTYVLMADSLYADGDLTYTADDLARAQRMQPGDLPRGLFLTKHGDRYVYGKPFIYPVAALPWYAVFGQHGFMVFNGVLLATLILLGADILARRLPWHHALLVSAVVFGFTVTPIYLLWIDPFLIGSVLTACAVAAYCRDRPVLAAVPVALLAAMRPPYLVLAFAPLALYALARRWRALAWYVSALALSAALLVGVEWMITGTWAAHTGGERYYYNRAFPLQLASDEPELGVPAAHPLDLQWLGWAETARRTAYFYVGRYAGVLPYFPSLLACLLWVRRWDGEKTIWLVALVLVGQALQVAVPGNPFGGGATVGNRLFVLLPVALLWVDFIALRFWRIAASAALIAVAVPVLQMSTEVSIAPGKRMLLFPHRYLPFEWPYAPRAKFPDEFYGMSALTANQHSWEGTGVWTRGGTTAEFVLVRPDEVPARLRLWSFVPGVRIVDGDVTLPIDWVPGRHHEVTLSHPVARIRSDFTPGKTMVVYRVRIESPEGTVAATVGRRTDFRYLGVFVEPLPLRGRRRGREPAEPSAAAGQPPAAAASQ